MLLVGIVGENTGTAAKLLRKAGVSLKAVREKVEEMIGRGSAVVSREISFTPAAKRVLQEGVAQLHKLESNYVDPAHIILALLEEDGGTAAKFLEKLGVDVPKVPDEIKAESKERNKEPVGVSAQGQSPSRNKAARSRSSGGTSPRSRRRGAWTPWWGVRSNWRGPSRSWRGGRRITRYSLASQASARRPLPMVWHSGSSAGTPRNSDWEADRAA